MITRSLLLLSILLFLSALYTAPSLAQTTQGSTIEKAQVYRGGIPITRTAIQQIELAPELILYPGEAITVVTTGKANVNQHNYEKRRCKYFGMKCWYEKRSTTRLRSATVLEVEVGLYDDRGELSGKLHTITNGNNVVLENPWGGIRTRGLHLRAYVKRDLGTSRPISRQSCGSRPKHCSSGEIGLAVTANVEKRRDALSSIFDNLNGDDVNSAQIMSRNYLDPLLYAGEGNRVALQKLLGDDLQRWVGQASKTSQGQLVELIQYALKLSSDRDNRVLLIDSLMTSQGKSGNFEELEASATIAVRERSKACESDCSVEDAKELITAMQSLATAKTERSARNRLSDITISVAILQKGVSVLSDALGQQTFSTVQAEFKDLSNIHQSLADKLMLIRTPAEIELAVQHMQRSVCLHRVFLGQKPNGSSILANEKIKASIVCPVKNMAEMSILSR